MKIYIISILTLLISCNFFQKSDSTLDKFKKETIEHFPQTYDYPKSRKISFPKTSDKTNMGTWYVSRYTYNNSLAKFPKAWGMLLLCIWGNYQVILILAL